MGVSGYAEPNLILLRMNISSIRSMLIGNILGDYFLGRNSLGSFISFEQSLAK
jgi:hypothetical protein